MKQVCILFLLTIGLYACSKSGDIIEDNEEVEDVPKEITANIIPSDSVVGVSQVIELTLEYSTSNPNILITWFQDNEKLNNIPKSDLSYLWCPAKTGKHKLRAVITDRDKIVEAEIEIDVVKCELADAIIGDNIDKILRTKGDKSLVNNVLTYNESGKISQYYFSDNILTKIFYLVNVNRSLQTKYDFMYPMQVFKSYYDRYIELFGEPVEDGYAELGTTEADLVRYGGYIFSGSMRVWAKFSNDYRNAEITVEPSNYYNSGFCYTQQIEQK